MEDLVSQGVISEKILKQLIDSYIRSAQYKKAIHILERLYQMHKSAQIANVLAVLYLKTNTKDKLEVLCSKHPKLSGCIAFRCLDNKEFPVIGISYSEFIEAGQILLELEAYTCALKMYQLALTQRPKNANVYATIAVIHSDLDQLDSALKNIDIAITLDPKNADYYFRKGVILERHNKVKESIKWLEKAIELRPDSATYLNYLGYLLIVREIDVDRGTELVQKALKISPDNPSYLDSLAWGYFKKCLYNKALEIQEKALQKNPDNAVILFHYAEILFKLGRKQEALKYYRKCKQLLAEEKDLSPWEKEEIVKRLKELGL